MTTNKITERDIYNSILDGSFDVDVLKEFAEKKLAQLDRRNETAKTRAAKKRAESDEIAEGVFAVLTDELQTRAQVTDAYNEANGSELSEAKIGARLNRLFADGRVTKEQVKVAGDDGKTKTVMAYAIVTE